MYLATTFDNNNWYNSNLDDLMAPLREAKEPATSSFPSLGTNAPRRDHKKEQRKVFPLTKGKGKVHIVYSRSDFIKGSSVDNFTCDIFNPLRASNVNPEVFFREKPI